MKEMRLIRRKHLQQLVCCCTCCRGASAFADQVYGSYSSEDFYPACSWGHLRETAVQGRYSGCRSCHFLVRHNVLKACYITNG